MKTLFSLIFLFFITASATAQEVTGDWYGNLEIKGQKLGIVIHVSKTETGYSATMDSPDQNGYGIPVDSTTFEDDVLEIKAPRLGGLHYKAQLEKDILSGSFKQAGALVPLKLFRGKPEAKVDQQE